MHQVQNSHEWLSNHWLVACHCQSQSQLLEQDKKTGSHVIEALAKPKSSKIVTQGGPKQLSRSSHKTFVKWMHSGIPSLFQHTKSLSTRPNLLSEGLWQQPKQVWIHSDSWQLKERNRMQTCQLQKQVFTHIQTQQHKHSSCWLFT